MLKKTMAGLLALVLCLSVCSVSLALTSDEVYEFDAIVAGEMSFMVSADESVSTSSNRTWTAAMLMFEFLIYQAQNDIEMESRVVYNDCVIGSKDKFIAVAYDTGESELILLVYDSVAKNMNVGYLEASLENAKKGFENDGYNVYTVDGTDWSDALEELFSIVLGEE